MRRPAGRTPDSERAIAEMRGAGVAVVLVSSDFPELLALSDRILVVRHGRIAGEAHARTQADLIALAAGERAPDSGARRKEPA